MVAVAALVWDRTSSNNAVTQPQSSLAENMPVGGGPEKVDRMREAVENTPPISPEDINRPDELTTDNTKKQSDMPPVRDEKIIERDLFVATDIFHQGLQEKAKQKTDALPEDLQICSDLSGIFIGSESRYAVFGENLVPMGKYIGPYRVLQINPTDVVLETDSGPITLYWK